jgi:hypothetical protein
VELASQLNVGPRVVWSHLPMDGRVTVTMLNTNSVYILVSLFFDYIDRCSIFNPKSGVCLLQN